MAEIDLDGSNTEWLLHSRIYSPNQSPTPYIVNQKHFWKFAVWNHYSNDYTFQHSTKSGAMQCHLPYILFCLHILSIKQKVWGRNCVMSNWGQVTRGFLKPALVLLWLPSTSSERVWRLYSCGTGWSTCSTRRRPCSKIRSPGCSGVPSKRLWLLSLILTLILILISLIESWRRRPSLPWVSSHCVLA